MAGTHPLVSAVYVVTGFSEFLPFSLESVCPAVDQVVVLCAGATDHAAAVARSFGPKVMVAQASSADAVRHQALALATGEWILEMDAGRVFFPDLARLLPDLLADATSDGYLVSEYQFRRDFWHVENAGDRDPAHTSPLLVRRGAAADGGGSQGASLRHSGLLCAQYGDIQAPSPGPDRPFTRGHPAAMRQYVASRQPRPAPSLTGLMLTTFNDINLLPKCIGSLRQTLSDDHRLVAVDMGSTDGTTDFLAVHGTPVLPVAADSLAIALNMGLRHFLADPAVHAVCWIHPDMSFTSGWLPRLEAFQADHPAIGKLVPRNIQSEADWGQTDWSAAMDAGRGIFVPGNGCPWLIHRATLETTGLFDEGYVACGGYEDWDHNRVLLQAGYKVGYTHASAVWHGGMGSRTRRPQNFVEWARQNALRYYQKWGTNLPPV